MDQYNCELDAKTSTLCDGQSISLWHRTKFTIVFMHASRSNASCSLMTGIDQARLQVRTRIQARIREEHPKQLFPCYAVPKFCSNRHRFKKANELADCVHTPGVLSPLRNVVMMSQTRVGSETERARESEREGCRLFSGTEQ